MVTAAQPTFSRITNHLPAALQPHEEKSYPHFADGKMKFRAVLPHYTHSWMENQGMLEGLGMVAAPGTA